MITSRFSSVLDVSKPTNFEYTLNIVEIKFLDS